ncbi:MAG TPA: hypothetical protein DDW41_05115 [Candidatus Andersenbacteria bacterium]|nr:hypothetical protein [Candidatus Andersenbacteria bacterium]
MTTSVLFYTSSFTAPSELPLYQNSVLFHGDAVDDRGASAVGFVNGNIRSRIFVEYDYDNMTIKVGDKEISADRAAELFGPYVAGRNVVLESTTLGFSELFLIIRSLIDTGIKSFLIIYVEPQEYSRTKPGSDSFALSELNAGYKPIPRAVVDLAGEDVEAGVFFLGYEPERLERAFEEYQMLSSKDIKVVFGIPAFQPGWELNSIVPHLEVIEHCNVQYCAANDPSSAYDALEVTLKSLSAGNKMFVAPIGTKPCGVAAALFASMNPEQVGLLYDHRKKKNKRSSGVSVWHRYAIKIR